MTVIQSLVLSIVEGLTEFLPISSTGHMILASDLLNIIQTPFVKSFEIFIQLGAILAIVVLYFKTFLNFKFWPKILAAFIPTAIIGFGLYKIVKTFLLGNTWVTLGALLIGGLALILIERKYHEEENAVGSIEDISYKDAVILGVAQSLAIIPGVSRSAATIVGGLLLGLKRTTAVEFSFILAVPTMLAASSLDLYESHLVFSDQEYLLLGIGFVGAFATAIIAVKFLVNFVKSHNFVIFGWYRILLTILFFVLFVK